MLYYDCTPNVLANDPRWTRDPTTWDNDYFDLLFGYEWELGTGAGGALGL